MKAKLCLDWAFIELHYRFRSSVLLSSKNSWCLQRDWSIILEFFIVVDLHWSYSLATKQIDGISSLFQKDGFSGGKLWVLNENYQMIESALNHLKRKSYPILWCQRLAYLPAIFQVLWRVLQTSFLFLFWTPTRQLKMIMSMKSFLFQVAVAQVSDQDNTKMGKICFHVEKLFLSTTHQAFPYPVQAALTSRPVPTKEIRKDRISLQISHLSWTEDWPALSNPMLPISSYYPSTTSVFFLVAHYKISPKRHLLFIFSFLDWRDH